MEYKKDKKSAYLTGYQNLSTLDKSIKTAGGTKWESDWEKTGEKKLYNYSDDLIRKGKMYTNDEKLFRYSLNNINTMFEDPTYLIFDIKFDSENSPLFNYSDFPPVSVEKPKIDKKIKTGVDVFSKQKEKQEAPNKTKKEKNTTTKKTYEYKKFNNPSPISFINKYKIIPEIKEREIIYFDFIETIDSIFKRTYSTNKFNKSYYIESISGLDKIFAKMVKYGEDKITIKLTEDVSLRSTYLSELYNNLIYSYKNQRYIMPENCLRFDMMINITDIRIFKYLENIDGNVVQKINNDPPRIVYTLHDCNFDFSKSIPFQQTMTIGGIGASNPGSNNNLSFDIKYKSISKSFRSSLIYGSLEIHNKLTELINSKILTRSEMFNYDIDSNEKIKIQEKKEKFSNSESLGNISGIKGNPINQISSTLNDKRKNEMQLINLKKENVSGQASTLNDKRKNEMQLINLKKENVSGQTSSTLNDKRKNEMQLVNQSKEEENVSGQTSSTLNDKRKNEMQLVNQSKEEENASGQTSSTLSKQSNKEKLKDFGEGLGKQLKESAIENIDEYKNRLISKYNDIRGELLQDMLRQIREPFNMPRIYPDNVYSSDFRTLSLESFAKGLGSSLLNDTLDTGSDTILGITDLPF